MKLFQIVVFGAVSCANVHWQITPNGYLASLFGIGAAFVATHAALTVVEALRWIGSAKRRDAPVRPPALPKGHASGRW
jgi:hypothetical protein